MLFGIYNIKYILPDDNCTEHEFTLISNSHISLQAVMNEMNSYSFFIRSFVSIYIKSLGVEMFMTRTVHEFLWGFKDPLMAKLHALKPEVDEYFGLMYKVRILKDFALE